MKEVCKKLQIDTKVYRERMLLGAISHAQDEAASVGADEAGCRRDWNQQKSRRVLCGYQAQLRKNNALDF